MMQRIQWTLVVVAGFLSACGLSEISSLGAASEGEQAQAQTSPNAVRSVALRNDIGCATLASGEIQCWGNNSLWQLGFQSPAQVTRPGTPVQDTLAVSISPSGEHHQCAASLGRVRCWGFSQQGILGSGAGAGRSHLPRTVSGIAGQAVAVANATQFSCALNDAGRVQCWGGNNNLNGIPRTPPGLESGVLAIAGDNASMCAIRRTADGASTEVLCWGHNPAGNLGDGTTSSRDLPRVTLPIPSGHAVSISAASYRVCVTTNEGNVYCWGSNTFGSLMGAALDTDDQILQPTLVNFLPPGMAQVAVGGDHVCARSNQNDVYCWGYNSKGQLQNFLTPVQHRVVGPQRMMLNANTPFQAKQVAAGYRTTCAIDLSDRLWCWGRQDGGVLGNGASSGISPVPVQISLTSTTGGSLDAGTPVTPDAGTPDAGALDAGTPDAGTPDAGNPDAGTPDAGTGGGACQNQRIDDVGQLRARRSLMVTDVAVLEGANGQPSPFRFERLMNQLVFQSNVPFLTAQDLYNQWWDTQNRRPGFVNQGPHCDDSIFADGRAAFNGFPWQCRRREGDLVFTHPFDPQGAHGYRPIALVNRIDLMPTSGANCGEYRMVYGKNGSRNLIIFEAKLPNPRPDLGVHGCFPVAKFWADLSLQAPTASQMQSRLEQFYFQGLPGFAPVVHVAHYVQGAGQIRTNQFVDTFQGWALKQFNLRRNCGGLTCLKFEPMPVENNPYPPLFLENHPRWLEFINHFGQQVPALSSIDLNRFGMSIDDTFNTGASLSQGTFTNIPSVMVNSQSPLNSYLPYALLNPQGRSSTTMRVIEVNTPTFSNLTAEHILNRATVTSCAGCHQVGGGLSVSPTQLWPASLGFVHIGEFADFNSGGEFGAAFPISPALRNLFLPFRRQVLMDYYNTHFCGVPQHSGDSVIPSGNIGGTRFGH